MSDTPNAGDIPEMPQIPEMPEVIDAAGPEGAEVEAPAISEPAKVMRIGAMIRTLLEEVRQADLDEASRDRMREIYEHSVRELAEALSPDLQEELHRLALPFESDTPSEADHTEHDTRHRRRVGAAGGPRVDLGAAAASQWHVANSISTLCEHRPEHQGA